MGDSAADKKQAPPGDELTAPLQVPAQAPGPIRSPMMRDGAGGNRQAVPGIKPMTSLPSRGDQSPTPDGNALSPKNKPKPEQKQNDFVRPEVSAIRGLQESQQETMATALSHHMFDTTRETRKVSLKIAYFLIPIAIAAILALKPEWGRKLWFEVQTSTQQFMHKIRPPRKTQTKIASVSTSTVTRPKLTEATPSRVIANGNNCVKITSSVIASDPSLSLGDRVVIAECFLALDNAQNAEEILRPLKKKLQATPENILNRQQASGTLAEAQQILVFAYLKMAKPREAEEMLRNRCTRWQQTNTCVAKLMIHADRRYDSLGLKPLFETSGRLDRKAQARLWYAGAAVALQENKPNVADQRYTLALKAAPSDALALRKQIYETQAIDLYHRGESMRLKASITAARTDLTKLDPKAKIKLAMLEELVTATDKRRTLKKLLTREDITYRARSDMDLMNILGPESLRYALESEYLRLLGRTRKVFSERFAAGNGVLKRISMWEIRTLFSQKKYDATVQALAQYENSFGQDAITHHFTGLLDLHSDSNKESARMAVAHFQDALRAKGGWESRYALGVALIRGGHADLVPPIIRDLENNLRRSGERFWTDMLKAEWYTSVGKYVNAVKILQDWVKKEPDFSTPRELLVDVLSKMGNKTGAEEQLRVLDELRRRQPAGMSQDVFASPLGALAYEERPLN